MSSKLTPISHAAAVYNTITGYIDAINEKGADDPIGYVGEIMNLTYLLKDLIGASDLHAEAARIEATRIYSSVFGIAESFEKVCEKRNGGIERPSRFDDPTAYPADVIPFPQ